MTKRRAERLQHNSKRKLRREKLQRSRVVHRKTGTERERFTLNLGAVAKLPPDSERYIEYEQAFARFCWALGDDWHAWLRKSTPADAGKDCKAKRPCRFFGCPHHLAIERVDRDSLSLRLLQPFTKLKELPFTCVFDVVRANPDGAPMSLIGSLLALKKQGVHYHWRLAQQKWKATTRELEKERKMPSPSSINTTKQVPKQYAPHRLAALLPLLDEKGLHELAADIRAHGLREKIVLYEGQILDGRNREAACKLAGVDPQYVPWVPKPGEKPVDFVVSMNLHRRHLSESQRAVLAVAVAKERGEDGLQKQQSSRFANLQNGVNTKALDQAAADCKVSPRSAHAAKAVLSEGTPELVNAVVQGGAAVSAAAAVASLSPAKQREVAAGGKPAVAEAAKKIREKRQRAAVREERRENPVQFAHKLLEDAKASVQRAVRQWPESEPKTRLIRMLRDMVDELESA